MEKYVQLTVFIYMDQGLRSCENIQNNVFLFCYVLLAG